MKAADAIIEACVSKGLVDKHPDCPDVMVYYVTQLKGLHVCELYMFAMLTACIIVWPCARLRFVWIYPAIVLKRARSHMGCLRPQILNMELRQLRTNPYTQLTFMTHSINSCHVWQAAEKLTSWMAHEGVNGFKLRPFQKLETPVPGPRPSPKKRARKSKTHDCKQDVPMNCTACVALVSMCSLLLHTQS